MTASDGVRHQFTTLFDHGVFEGFPRLEVLVLDSGDGWIGDWRDRFLWASDFPHADHTPEYLLDLAELASGFPEGEARRRFLGDNARRLFDIAL